MKNYKLLMIVVLVLLVVISNLLFSFNDTKYTITVTDKERIYDSSSSKYLVFGEDKNGTSLVFENTDCFLRGKWNSSNVQGELKEGHTYTIVVVGYRAPFLSMYQNIISIDEEIEV